MKKLFLRSYILILTTFFGQISPVSSAVLADQFEQCQRYLKVHSRWVQWVKEVDQFKKERFLHFDYHFSIGVLLYRDFSSFVPSFNTSSEEELFEKKRQAARGQDLDLNQQEAFAFLDQLGNLIRQVEISAHYGVRSYCVKPLEPLSN